MVIQQLKRVITQYVQRIITKHVLITTQHGLLVYYIEFVCVWWCVNNEVDDNRWL